MAKEFKMKQDGWKRQKLYSKAVVHDWQVPDPLQDEVRRLLEKPKQQEDDVSEAREQMLFDASQQTLSEPFHEVELVIEEMSTTGEGLARNSRGDHVYVIPFALPGERVRARVRKHPKPQLGPSSKGDFVKVLDPSPRREGVTPQCKYFTMCSGCQFQMLSYENQLAQKKTTMEKAFHRFAGLNINQIPEVDETGPSPLQYSYRTKLTPHFNRPPSGSGKGRNKKFTSVPPIGFGYKGKGEDSVLDIESCPIGTDIVQKGLTRERASVAANIAKYKNGATILIRQTTNRIPTAHSSDLSEPPAASLFDNPNSTAQPAPSPPPSSSVPPTEPETIMPQDPLTPLPPPSSATLSTSPKGHPSLHLTYPSLPFTDITTYNSDTNAPTTEYVGTYKFTTRAGSFFQNNNSILPSFLSYVRSKVIPPTPHPSLNTTPKYLLDAYSGAGLFALTLSPLFSSVLGVESDAAAVAHARQNATNNKITNCGFIEADASDLFADVPYPPAQTVVVIDPPRKGCSKGFLCQLLKFGAGRVVYVSCNVNSQARDVGVLVTGGVGVEGVEDEGRKWRYEIESLKGWDFFPQTAHVEGVCVLNRVEIGEEEGRGKVEVERE